MNAFLIKQHQIVSHPSLDGMQPYYKWSWNKYMFPFLFVFDVQDYLQVTGFRIGLRKLHIFGLHNPQRTCKKVKILRVITQRILETEIKFVLFPAQAEILKFLFMSQRTEVEKLLERCKMSRPVLRCWNWAIDFNSYNREYIAVYGKVHLKNSFRVPISSLK